MRRSFLLLVAAGLLGGARAAATKRRNMLFFIAECASRPGSAPMSPLMVLACAATCGRS